MPVCDLDKRVPHAKKMMGLDVVVWWDRNESAWKVFDDTCPHRLAPLSEGRIDRWGRLQCVYHGCTTRWSSCKKSLTLVSSCKNSLTLVSVHFSHGLKLFFMRLFFPIIASHTFCIFGFQLIFFLVIC
ncbi:hypothetical protein P3X46_034480 [Hevea brasiliensis]|uniref:Rieske domain-containing protein n=1 Tax=Hevea brasiliensis TaxID=3981 RepID=A0ABQ9K897_HEVBR|nr:hypothetical protein P3X46_034480 [Hevea brasiliensis]